MNKNLQFLPKHMQNKYYKSFRDSNLPTRYWDKTLKDFNIVGTSEEKRQNKESFAIIEDYIENLDENIENGKGLYIWGPTRVGKSMITTSIMKSIGNRLVKINRDIGKLYGKDSLEHKNTVYFIQATTLYKLHFRSSCSDSELAISHNLQYQRALAIDDISKLEYAGGDIKIFMFDDLIRYRQLNGLITIYTSQFPLIEMKNLLNESIYNIIKETCEEVCFLGNPYYDEV